MNRVFYRSCEAMLEIPDGVVQTCVTSPPYFGLRDYGTATWEGGDPECGHAVRLDAKVESSTLGGGKATVGHQREGFRQSCPRCGAVRVDEQIGLEPTLDCGERTWLIAKEISNENDALEICRQLLAMQWPAIEAAGEGYVREVLSEIMGSRTVPTRPVLESEGIEDRIRTKQAAGVAAVEEPAPQAQDASNRKSRWLLRLLWGGAGRVFDAGPYSRGWSRASEGFNGEQSGEFPEDLSGRSAARLSEGRVSDSVLQLQLLDWMLGILPALGFIADAIPASSRSRFEGYLCGKCYVCRIVKVMRSVRRVLRDDGTLWLNLGDSFFGDSPVRKASSEAWSETWDPSQTRSRGGNRRSAAREGGLKPKDLIGVPWAVAFALRADGWWLRSDIVWHKVPCMPESITDRPTRAHEFIFLLSKSARYFYDADAIREPLAESSEPRLNRADLRQKEGWDEAHFGNPPSRLRRDKQVGSSYGSKERGYVPNNTGHAGFDERWQPGFRPEVGANKRDVWKIAPAQYSEAHFATFPPEIPALCIRAGSKPGDLVLDPFAGSGTTLEVAESLGRAWVGYELNLGYRPLIEARLRQQGLFTAGNA